ncbi:D-Ala-D-Ala carboxypeptidase family metallohydrolase [Eubacterium maltosivorans]|uniref:D-Ala-D-Ala carboxypeptidase family metallohydrolase n=1 Tax=Eubacterium maltosivorans TaxID=2041044 RepID=UPI003A9549A3
MASAHFALWEYVCDCAGYCDGYPHSLEPELLEKVEALRTGLGRPVIITSGVRCEARNQEVGGVSWSFHKRGAAADLYCPGVGVGEVAAAAQAAGLNILPHYSEGYIHVEIP